MITTIEFFKQKRAEQFVVNQMFFQIQSKTDEILLTCKVFRSLYLFRLSGN